MRILALDTSASPAVVCITEDNSLLFEEIINYKKTHSETLMPMIDEALLRSGTDISQIDLFAVANGPGSFTGLRIGVSAVKGMAEAVSKPVIGISTIEAMAYNLFMCPYIICPIMDARRSQVYNGVYTWRDEVFCELSAPRALSIEECVADVKKYEKKVIFLGDGVEVHREYIISELGAAACFAPASCNEQRASSIAMLARRRASEGMTAGELLPFYLRKPQAEREREEKENKR